MQKVKVIASSSVRGNPLERMSLKIMEKYLVGLHFEFSETASGLWFRVRRRG